MVRFSASISGSEYSIKSTGLNEFKTRTHSFYLCGMKGQEKKFIKDGNDPLLLLREYRGVCVKVTDSRVEVINDPFGSVPLFICARAGLVLIDSDFSFVKDVDVTIDVAGCYEVLMYEAGLFDRTPFREIKQMPAASRASINLVTGEISIEPHWDYCITMDETVKTDEDAIDRVWARLSEIYGGYDSARYLMGLSGGLDSRLSLYCLASANRLEKIDSFTFGHDQSIKDYTLAVETCKRLGVDVPVFYKLDESTYRDSMRLPLISGGNIGAIHGHIYWSLGRMSLSESTLISNYYSDAVMGYDCRPTDTDIPEESDYFKRLKENIWNASSEVYNVIEEDLWKIIHRRSMPDNYSGYNEFIYITERNPKFHMQLSYLYSKLIDVETPFADYELLRDVISLRKEIRYYKRIERMILNHKLGGYEDISSMRYAGHDPSEAGWTEKMKYDIGFARMKLLNRANSALAAVSGGRMQIPNPYITENLLAAFYYFSEKEKAIADGILCDRLRLFPNRNPLEGRIIRTADAVRGFAMLGLANMLSYYMDGKELINNKNDL